MYPLHAPPLERSEGEANVSLLNETAPGLKSPENLTTMTKGSYFRVSLWVSNFPSLLCTSIYICSPNLSGGLAGIEFPGATFILLSAL